MRINSNIPALNCHRLLNRNNDQLSLALEKLSSGKRINRAADDAAGLAISQKMEAQIRGLRQASRNALDGVSMVQTGEGALDEIHSMLRRMRELSVQGANGIYEDGDLDAIFNEMKELTSQIDKISQETDFNGIKLLTGQREGMDTTELALQVGANKDEHISIDLADLKVDISELGQGDSGESSLDDLINGGQLETSQDYSQALASFDNAISYISSIRAKMGAFQNRLESTISNLDNSAENLSSAKSRIEDLDMALEMSNFTKLQVLQQAGISMLGEANSLPQSVLQLLQG